MINSPFLSRRLFSPACVVVPLLPTPVLFFLPLVIFFFLFARAEFYFAVAGRFGLPLLINAAFCFK